jgi:hypothetical protein
MVWRVHIGRRKEVTVFAIECHGENLSRFSFTVPPRPQRIQLSRPGNDVKKKLERPKIGASSRKAKQEVIDVAPAH